MDKRNSKTTTVAWKFLPPLPLKLAHGCILVLALVLSTPILNAQNAVQIENAKQGTSSWIAGNLAFNHEIEGYASLTSVNQGGQITFFVSTADPSYTINIYRMGWYGGLGARAVLSAGPLTGVQQTIPAPDPTTGLIECNWTASYVLNLTSATDPVSNWVSGVYVALLTGTSGKQRYMVFVVRDDARSSNFYFQCAVNTYQAYNNWGGKSLYAFDSVNSSPATKVSFNRPYGQSYGDDGSGDFLRGWEYDAVRFLEREGNDLTYGTDLDAHESPSLLLAHKAVLIAGHSEYWSMAMRTNLTAARDSGVSLGILGGNVCYWQVRLEPSVVNAAADRTMVGYKDFAKSKTSPGPDPDYTTCISKKHLNCSLVTVRWRDTPVSMPENALVGIMWANDPVNGDILVTNASSWVFNTSGLANNETMPGLLGYEVDSVSNNGLAPAGLVVLAASPYTVTGTTTTGIANMTVYTAASGATVFASGSFQFSWGLDDYSLAPNGLVNFGAQQMTRNLLARFIGDQPPLADPGGPYTGSSLLAVQFDGTHSSDPDGVVNTYEWDFGDGTTGIGSFPTHAYAQGGTYTVSLVVTDNEGSRNAATTTATITDQPSLTITFPTLSFSDQLVGTSSSAQSEILSNAGAVPLAIAGIVATGDYSQTNTCGSSLAAGSNCFVNVTFTPTATGSRPGGITITDNNNGVNGSTQTVPLSGTGIAPAASVLPTTLSFRNQLVSTSSPTQPAVLSNTGAAPLTVASIVAMGDYSQTNDCGSSLAVGGSCTITVTFTPTAAGSRLGAITITDNNNAVNGSTQTVTLAGTGAISTGTVVPSSLNFGNQFLGALSAAQAVTITNTGTLPITFYNFGTSGDFVIVGSGTTCSTASPLAAGTSCAIAVTFTPAAIGPRKSSLVIADNGSGYSHAIILTGAGTSAGLSPSSLIFTDQSVGSTSASQQITLTNNGSGPINIWQTAILGVAASDYSQVSNCGSTLAAAASCTISVSFTPSVAGPRTATLVVSDDGGGGLQSAALTGNGVAPALPATSMVAQAAASNAVATSVISATSVATSIKTSGTASGTQVATASIRLSAARLLFDTQEIGASSSPQIITLTNTNDTAIAIGKVELTGAGHSDFDLTNQCGESLEAGQSCILQITFTPRVLGTRTATLTIEDSALGLRHQLSLAGTGLRPKTQFSNRAIRLF